jgi:hypothetical protein
MSWSCHCGFFNYGGTICRKCDDFKSKTISTGSRLIRKEKNGEKRIGDWDCPNTQCNFSNFSSRTECFKCGEKKVKQPISEAIEKYNEKVYDQSKIENECSICFSENRCVVPPCDHLSMCKSCSQKLSSCPICRKDYKQNQLRIVIIS